MKAIYLLGKGKRDLAYSKSVQSAIGALASEDGKEHTAAELADDPGLLAGVDFVFSGWGAPRLDADALCRADRLKAVFYAAGSVKEVATPALYDAGIRITSAYEANAVPVAEFTLGAILLSLKRAFFLSAQARRRRDFYFPFPPLPGGYGSTVGLVSLGAIGRRVAQKLSGLDVRVLAYDPYADEAACRALGLERVTSLEELFSRSDVVSLHAPWLSETEKMVQKRHILSMKPGSTLINTARGAVVDEAGLISALQERPDLYALLDVTYPEPPEPTSPLYTLENVFLTPHIAGSLQGECLRMGEYMLDEFRRYLAGEPLRYEITRERLATMA